MGQSSAGKSETFSIFVIGVFCEAENRLVTSEEAATAKTGVFGTKIFV